MRHKAGDYITKWFFQYLNDPAIYVELCRYRGKSMIPEKTIRKATEIELIERKLRNIPISQVIAYGGRDSAASTAAGVLK